jgi:hypothetical protein
MVIGATNVFAIESGITRAYEDLGLRALGFFALHIAGERYGVHAPDASLLACSLGEVEDTLARRGSHSATFAIAVDGGRVADAFRDAIYAPDQGEARFFGMSQTAFTELICAKHLVWAPDGDEAFDDGSFVLRFDVGDRVRLIGFRCGNDYHHDPKTLRDVLISASEYYGVLERWRDTFLAEWKDREKEKPKPTEPAPMFITDSAAQALRQPQARLT